MSTRNNTNEGNYTSVIKDILLYPNEPKKFTMVAFGKNVTNTNIFSGVYIQQKAHWDPDGILDDLTFENIHSEILKSKSGLIGLMPLITETIVINPKD